MDEDANKVRELLEAGGVEGESSFSEPLDVLDLGGVELLLIKGELKEVPVVAVSNELRIAFLSESKEKKSSCTLWFVMLKGKLLEEEEELAFTSSSLGGITKSTPFPLLLDLSPSLAIEVMLLLLFLRFSGLSGSSMLLPLFALLARW